METEQDGTIMDIGKEISRLAKEISAFEFDTEKQLRGYLKEHPLADTSKHWVKEQKPAKRLDEIFTDISDVRRISDLHPTENVGKEISREKLEKGKSEILKGLKRKPITVRNKNGRLEITDGNTTYNILKSYGYQEIPVKIDNASKTLRELQKEALEKGVSPEELTQVLPSGFLAGNSKKWIESRLLNKTAMEFDTKEALEKYLKEHPNADKSLHHVKPQTPLKTEVQPSQAPVHESIMRPEFEKLPDSAKQQGVNNADDFYSQAQQSYEDMTKLLDKGAGLDVKIGANVITPKSSEEFEKALDTENPVIVIGSIKGKSRAEEKVNADYGGDWSKLKDGVRATVSVKRVSDLGSVFNQLESLGMRLAQKPKDRYEKPTVSGYRDILLNVQYPNGHIGELQINCHDMLKAKIQGHKIYEQARTVEAKAKQEGRDYMTDDELAIVADANRRMKALYESAYQASLRS